MTRSTLERALHGRVERIALSVRKQDVLEPAESRAGGRRQARGRAHADRFAVAQLLNKRDGALFDASDEARFAEFARGVAPILEGWVRMSSTEARRAELMRDA